MNEIKDYFDRIKLTQPAEQLADTLIRSHHQNSPKRRFKPAAAVAAAAAVLTVSVTGAAAGLLDFNAIFGGFMMSEDEKLAQELLSCAENVEWYTSDENYQIVLKGVTGSGQDMLVNYEIVRTDGKPVKDFFTNLPQDGRLASVSTGFIRQPVSPEQDVKMKSTTQIAINEEGNIEFFGRLISDTDITGSRQSNEGYNFYPDREFRSFKYVNRLFDVIVENGAMFSHGVEGAQFAESDIPLTDERIIGLPLEWKISFDYYPTEAALKSKSISDMSQTLILRQKYGLEGLMQKEYTIFDSSFTSVGGRIMIQCDDTTPRYTDATTIANEYMDSYIITSDGKQYEVALNHIGDYFNEQDESIDMLCIDVRYSTDKSSEITVINIDDITAISINGTVFPIN